VLLRHGASPNAPGMGDASCTALYAACAAGRQETVAVLLEHGADPNAPGPDHNVPLVSATRNGVAGVVKLLLGAGPDAEDSMSGMAVLALAAKQGHRQVVKLLLDAKADVDAQRAGTGFNALMTAAIHGNLAITKILLERGARTDLRDASGSTAAMMAETQGHLDVAEVLLLAAAGEPIPGATDEDDPGSESDQGGGIEVPALAPPSISDGFDAFPREPVEPVLEGLPQLDFEARTARHFDAGRADAGVRTLDLDRGSLSLQGRPSLFGEGIRSARQTCLVLSPARETSKAI
jgi:ankyrin repeat protein